jgi:hypothetical protein
MIGWRESGAPAGECPIREVKTMRSMLPMLLVAVLPLALAT